MGQNFVWFSRERKTNKRASGGVGLIGRKSVGDFFFVKSSSLYEILWVKMVRNRDVYYVGAVYIPPTGSQRELAKDVLVELETDIFNYRKLGKVILLGDFNCRFGGKESVIFSGNKQMVFSRITDERKGTGNNTNGSFW